jgi:hypothetical protein
MKAGSAMLGTNDTLLAWALVICLLGVGMAGMMLLQTRFYRFRKDALTDPMEESRIVQPTRWDVARKGLLQSNDMMQAIYLKGWKVVLAVGLIAGLVAIVAFLI